MLSLEIPNIAWLAVFVCEIALKVALVREYQRQSGEMSSLLSQVQVEPR